MLDIWLQRLMPAITGFGGACLGGWVTFRMYRLTTKREEKIRVENELKEKEALIRQMYGKLFSLQTIILNTLQLEIFHFIKAEYFSRKYELENNNEEKAIWYERFKVEYESKLQMSIRLREYLKDFSDIVGQYYYLNPKSDIMSLYSDFFEKSKKISQPLNLSQLTNLEEIHTKMEEESKRATEFCEKEIGATMTRILNCIGTGT